MAIIGFDTPSKLQAIKEQEKGENSPQTQEVVLTGLQADTFERLNALGNAIMSPEFATLPIEVKENMLNDFAYYKSVADTIS